MILNGKLTAGTTRNSSVVWYSGRQNRYSKNEYRDYDMGFLKMKWANLADIKQLPDTHCTSVPAYRPTIVTILSGMAKNAIC